MRCIFCQEPLRGRETSEHVLLNAFGGKVKTRKLSCAPCNNRFGGTIDRALAEQFAPTRNMFEMVSGDGKDAPSLWKVQAGNRKVNLLGNGVITLAGRPFIVEEHGDGQFRVEINVQSLEELEAVIPHIAAKTGISEERLREQLASAQFTDTQERPGTVHHQYSLGGEDAMRAVAKACLLLWARKFGNEEAQKPEYNEVRSFIRNGGPNFLTARTSLDSRPLPLKDELEASYGPLFNFLRVVSDSCGRVVGHLTIYNLIGFQVVLAEGGAAPCGVANLASDPLDPKIWSDDADLVADLDFTWLERPHQDTDEYRSRFAHMASAYYRIIGRRAHIRIIDRVLSRYGFAEGEAIPPDLIDSIAAEVGTRIAYNAVGIPLVMPVPPERVSKMVKRTAG